MEKCELCGENIYPADLVYSVGAEEPRHADCDQREAEKTEETFRKSYFKPRPAQIALDAIESSEKKYGIDLDWLK
jgi:hypothetical protein